MPNGRRQPDPRRAPLPFMLQLRVSDTQYRGIALEAEGRGVSMAQVVRDLIDGAHGRARMTSGPHAGKSLRQALEDDPSLTGYPEQLGLGGATEDAS